MKNLKVWCDKMNREPLSRRQKEFYDALVNLHKDKGFAPPLREMTFAHSFQNAYAYCKRLKEMGWVVQIRNRYIPVDSPLHPDYINEANNAR